MGLRVKLLDVSVNAKKLIYAAGRQCYAEGWAGDSWEDSSEDISILDKEGKEISDKEMEGLIKHLVDSGHTSVLEHVKFTFAIDGVSRSETHQQVRHRVASYCVSGDTKIYTSSQRTHKKPISELYRLKKQYRDLIKVKCVDEKTKQISYNNCLDIVYSGEKDLFEIITEHGYKIKTTGQHEYLTETGWKKLEAINEGDFVYLNGVELYKDKNWLSEQYRVNNLSQEDIGVLCGASKHTIRKWIRFFNLQKEFGSWSIGTIPANKGKTKYTYAPLNRTSKKMLGNLNGRYAFKDEHHSWKADQKSIPIFR